jgi:hypothetical protein
VQRCKKDQRYRGAKVLRRFSRGSVQRPQCRGHSAEAQRQCRGGRSWCRGADVQMCRVGAELVQRCRCRVGAEVLRC